MAIAIRTSELRIVGPNDDLIADLDLIQGLWSEEQYLKLTGDNNRLIEFTDGVIEVLPMPTDKHQAILSFLFEMLLLVVRPGGGRVRFPSIKVRVGPDKFREPDLLVLRDGNDQRRRNAYWLGADLVVEVVSPDNPERDTVFKRAEYAEAGIPEYWIVNPQDETFTVLRLDGAIYAEHGIFRRGDIATSPLLADFAVAVSDVFDAD